MLITFSGLDGAGKTTLIQHLKSDLEKKDRKVRILTMYDDISSYALLRKIRDAIKKLIPFRRREPRGSPATTASPRTPGIIPNSPKVDVSDKTGKFEKAFYRIFRSRHCRKLFLFPDLLVLAFYRLHIEKMGNRVLITDRYFYDSLADVADLKGRRWFFIRLFLKIAPHPDASVFVDVPAEKAFERKREYSVDYMKWRRETYHKIFGWVRNPVILLNDDLTATTVNLLKAANERLKP